MGVCVHQLVSLPTMGKGKFRTLKDLYRATHLVSLSKQPFKFEMEEKLRTCNPCVTRCSTFMHLDRVAALVGVGTGDFTDKTFREKRADRCSSSGGVPFSLSLSSGCDCRQHPSSEASIIFNLSSCHNLFSETAESQATFRDSDPCKDVELLSNIRKAQRARESDDTPKGIRQSNSANLAIGNHNGDPDRKNASSSSASDDSFPMDEKDVNERLGYHFVTVTHFDEANCNCSDVQNFTDESPLAEVVLSNRSDQSDISSLQDFYDCALSEKGEPFECSGEQLESSLAKAAISELGSQIDGIYSYPTFRGTGPHMNCFETESHSYCKKHLQKSVAVIKNTSMQESWQSQPGDLRGVSDLMDDEVRVCDTCGDSGREDELALCNMCTDGAEHIYCMRVKLKKVPKGDWTCAECMLRSDTEKLVQDKVEEAARISKGRLERQKSESSIKFESRSSSKLKFRSSYAGRSGADDVSSTSHLSTKRHGVPLEAHSVKKARAIVTSAVPPKPSKPCNNSLLQRDFSSRNVKEGKMKSIKDIISALQIPCNSQEKARVPRACGDKKQGSTSKAELDKKERALETRVISPKQSKPSNQYFSGKREKMKSIKDIISALPISGNSQEKAKVPHACGDKKPLSNSEIELDKKGRALETRVISPKEPKPINQSLLSRELPFKNLGKVKLEVTGSVTSVKQSSCDTQQKVVLPYCLGDESPKLGSLTEITGDKCFLLKSRSSEAADLKSKGQVAKGNSLQKQMVERNPAFRDDGKGADPRMVPKSVSSNSVSSDNSNATCSEILVANAYCPKVLENLSCVEETKTTKGKDASELHNPAMCLLASDSGVTAVKKGKKETISSDETSFSGSNCCKRDAVQGCGQVDCRFQPSNHNTQKGQLSPNEEKRNESWQAEQPIKVATSMKIHKLCTSFASDEMSLPRDLAQFEEAILSQGFVIPKPDYIWLGKFHIHSNEGIASTCDGIQAHLSTCASLKVLEVADRLPEIIILDELPRLRMWPSQFMESQATEENIALYFFAKDLDSYRIYYKRLMEYMTKNDLALKGNLDGVELLIFPSNILPEKSRRWNQMLFLWGVFRGRKVINSINTPVSNSEKLENQDIVTEWALDLNAYPEDGDDMAGNDETPRFDSIGTRPSGEDRILLGGDSSRQALDKGGEKKPESAVIDLNISVWPESATQEDDGPWLSVGIEDNNKTDEELHGKLLTDKKNDTDSGDPSRSLSAASALPAICEENLDPLESQAVDALLFLSKGLGKI